MSEWHTGLICEGCRFTVIYGLVISYKKWNNLCTLVTNCWLDCYFWVYVHCNCTTWETNTKQPSCELMNSLPLDSIHYSPYSACIIIMTSKWARWRLKSPASRLFTQPFIQTQIKENIKLLRHWPLRGIHRGPVNSLHKWPVTQKMFPFGDAIMIVSDREGRGVLQTFHRRSIGAVRSTWH